MAKLGSLVKPRTALADIPAAIVATVVPVERSENAKRDPFAWAIDGYNTVKVMVYLPEGTTLPKGGVELNADDFDLDLMPRAIEVLTTYTYGSETVPGE